MSKCIEIAEKPGGTGSEMIKVLFFLTHLGGGGAEMHFVRLSHELRANGVEPIFATTRGGGAYEPLLQEDVEHIVLPTGGISSGTIRLVRSITPLADLIDRLKPDILCPVLSLTTLPAIVAAKRARHPVQVILSIQNALGSQLANTKQPFRSIQEFFTEQLWRDADGVIALSQGVANEIGQRFPALRTNIKVIYNIGKPTTDELRRAAATEIFPAPPGRMVAVACGRLTKQKNYPAMFAALAQIDARKRPFLRILGTGEDRTELEHLVSELGLSDDVEFLGFRGDVLSFMGAADMFLLSSRWEGFGNVIVEAMAMETAVISTACPHGPDEIITNGVNGVLVPVEEPAQLAKAIEALMANDALREQLAKAGSERADDFNAPKIARQYAKALHDFADQKSIVGAGHAN
ncbi:N-acetylgalactosamine-N,N'-diacetylbacillosaminyl-diphospho-undecaprenol4-alpha-N-acetylgalactosaminyltransferase [Alteripontixanthobacter maritimus]|uniref:N-acetylgalactosamine-N, N'-diacetylbacillosaminyl-diphospho-undecaprenol4-alpha-N-acetylgalactosaminyltransferase n=1 Tax=Alteripontixanthobacter maritimus TaxID=2161824 RepID=A0A369QAA3_9SPHN|nr:glycosyltransferase [Alteripontixanthobacter maritimus]RDC61392.1 N-acetylgalactosamine-N,N'-diacetylbacillosaminyl-diphospho-undecaprenol4-alpha-N-acetylgalactosaminyltransferase [Alteripontixanthobacter maritimus]